ncbi:response regulator transcription factor [Algimonas porphyrae]|nr:response regulator transcription factor [Algimonas porphyrae]
MKNQPKALIVEDIEDIARHTARTLEAAGWTVEHVMTGAEGLQRAQEDRFHVLIFDRMLPDAEGLDIVETLRAKGIMVPVLMLTALGQTESRVEGYERGADDYIAKPFEPAELVARAGALYRRGQTQVKADLHRIADLEIRTKARTAHRSGHHIALSPKEFDLLEYFARNTGELVTRDMLLRDVWGMHFDPGTNVVDVNISRLRRKIDGDFDTALLVTERGLGYRFGPGPSRG